MVMKSNTIVALAYVRSEFFRISLEMAGVYKMIQDKDRNNETILVYKNSNTKIKGYMAGARFHKDMIESTKSFDRALLSKIQAAVFTKNKEAAPGAW